MKRLRAEAAAERARAEAAVAAERTRTALEAAEERARALDAEVERLRAEAATERAHAEAARKEAFTDGEAERRRAALENVPDLPDAKLRAMHVRDSSPHGTGGGVGGDGPAAR